MTIFIIITIIGFIGFMCLLCVAKDDYGKCGKTPDECIARWRR